MRHVTGLRTWGLDQYGGAISSPEEDGLGRIGRVVRVDRGECDVMTEEGRIRVLSDSVRSQDEIAPVTGDWVDVVVDDELGLVIDRIFSRTSAVRRRDPAERDLVQVLAANVDLVAVVHGLDRPLPAGRLERLLVIAHHSGATPLVVLTKADTVDDDDDTADLVGSIVGDMSVVSTSIVDGQGLDEVRSMIGAGRTLALIGPSGVGKSALVNALVGAEVLEVGDVRDVDAKGRHTTTARELVLLPGDAGLVLDTPGIRAVGLWEAEDALELVFGDLEALAAECRFGDCGHDTEPGCAVVSAVEAGDIDHRRVARYRALTDELAAQRTREEERARREKKGGGNRGRGGGRRRR